MVKRSGCSARGTSFYSQHPHAGLRYLQLEKAASVALNALRWLLQAPHVYAAQTYMEAKDPTDCFLNKTGTNFLHTRFANVLILLEPNTLC